MIRGLAFALALSLGTPVSAAPSKPAPRNSRVHVGVVIDQIEITGATSVKQADLEPVLEILPGDSLDEVKVERSAANFQDVYRIKGFERAKIRVEVSTKKGEVVLDFIITENEPVRVGEVRFTQVDSDDVRKREAWSDALPAIQKNLGVAPGDAFDQDRIADGRRAVQDVLSSEYFVGSNMGDVRTTELTDPPAELRAKYPKATQWISLEVRVTIGERVHFGFRGNSAFTNRELMAIVEDQRALGFGRSYLDDIRVKTIEFYRNNGYPHAAIEAYFYDRSTNRRAASDKQATLVIEEGPRTEISEVRFEGAQIFAPSELKRQFFQSAPALVKAEIYVEKDVQRAAELLVEWLKSRGYLAAKLLSVHSQFPELPVGQAAGRVASITVYLYEGEQTVVNSVGFTGLDQAAGEVSEEEAKTILQVREGQPLNLFAFTDGLERIKARFRELGYLDAKVANEGDDSVVQYSQRNRVADIRVEFAPGPKIRLGKLQIEGLQKTRSEVVAREVQVKPGDVMEEPKLFSTDARLRKLNLFSTVQLRPVPSAQGGAEKDLVVAVQEGSPGLVGGGIGFRNDLGPRVFGFYEYGNLWGRNHSISLNAAVNRRLGLTSDRVDQFRFAEYSAQLSYRWPWVFLGDTNLRPNLSLTGTQYRNFDAISAVSSATLERKLAQLGMLQLTGLFTYALERTIQFNAVDISENRGIRIGSITPALRIDGRDNALAPTKGVFSYLSYEYASTALGSQADPYPIGYTRAQARLDYTQPLPLRASLYLSFRTGYERSTVDTVVDPLNPTQSLAGSGSIPLNKKFALGGAGSLRGFLEQELNFEDESIRGAISYVNYRTQLDLPFAGNLRFGPFLDAANLQLDQYSLSKNLRVGYGVGFHYMTPVGPVNLDWGYKHKPRPGETRMKFYFSIGIL